MLTYYAPWTTHKAYENLFFALIITWGGVQDYRVHMAQNDYHGTWWHYIAIPPATIYCHQLVFPMVPSAFR